MSRPGARAANRLNRSVQSEPLVLRMHRSEFSAAIVARPSGWLTSTFRMAICRDTHNSTPQPETVSNVGLPGLAVYGPLKQADGGMRAAPSFRSASSVTIDAPVLIDQAGGLCGWTAAFAGLPDRRGLRRPALGSEAARLGSRLIAPWLAGLFPRSN